MRPIPASASSSRCRRGPRARAGASQRARERFDAGRGASAPGIRQARRAQRAEVIGARPVEQAARLGIPRAGSLSRCGLETERLEQVRRVRAPDVRRRAISRLVPSDELVEDAAGDGEDVAPQLERQAGGDQRAGARRRLRPPRSPSARAAISGCAPGSASAPGVGREGELGDHARRVRRSACAERAGGRAGSRCRGRSREPRPSGRRRAASAPRCAAASIPRAKPGDHGHARRRRARGRTASPPRGRRRPAAASPTIATAGRGRAARRDVERRRARIASSRRATRIVGVDAGEDRRAEPASSVAVRARRRRGRPSTGRPPARRARRTPATPRSVQAELPALGVEPADPLSPRVAGARCGVRWSRGAAPGRRRRARRVARSSLRRRQSRLP